jgi:hypothetical protein
MSCQHIMHTASCTHSHGSLSHSLFACHACADRVDHGVWTARGCSGQGAYVGRGCHGSPRYSPAHDGDVHRHWRCVITAHTPSCTSQIQCCACHLARLLSFHFPLHVTNKCSAARVTSLVSSRFTFLFRSPKIMLSLDVCHHAVITVPQPCASPMQEVLSTHSLLFPRPAAPLGFTLGSVAALRAVMVSSGLVATTVRSAVAPIVTAGTAAPLTVTANRLRTSMHKQGMA